MHIPTLLLLTGILALSAVPATAQSIDTGFGYEDVNAALRDLYGKPGHTATIENDWLIITDQANAVLWSFAERTHPAHPSGVRRQVIETDGLFFIQMNVICGAEKPVCDQLVADFKKLNAEIRANLARNRKQ